MGSSRPPRILYMEDDPGLARLLEKKLSKAGYVVDVARDGEEGLAKCSAHAYDMVAVDQDMPVHDGLEVIRILSAKRALPPTIMITGSGNEQTAVEAMKLGARDYMVKDAEGAYLKLLPAVVEQTLKQQELMEQKERAEHELRIKDHAIASSVSAFAIADLLGSLTYVNNAWLNMYGYDDAGEVIGTGSAEFFSAKESALPPTEELHARGSWEGELVGKRKDGSPFDVYIMASTVTDESGEPVCLTVSGIDITERKRADEALRKAHEELEMRVEERTAELKAANEELALASRHKDEFLASMSHELRTPLNAVLGMSEALMEEAYGPVNEKQRKSLHTVSESGQHLLAIINDVLDIAKIGAGKLKLQMGPVPVDALCQSALRLVGDAADKKQLEVNYSFDGSVSTVRADQRRLKQILVNLLSNAVKFTPEGGRIGLEVTGGTTQGEARLTVWDTGIGISNEDMKRLFASFVQLDSALSRQYEGSGLGLSLAKQLAELQGAKIGVESELGQGSRFTVCFPVQRRDEYPRAESSESASAHREGRTLPAGGGQPTKPVCNAQKPNTGGHYEDQRTER